ncbi:PRP4 pre-mRNA processing factor 4 [Musa troglodytarum]|uniref:PRP4 pre-mRNA processing factor 4 n=1 Tax=Musa troglodytarum TaxID=320322 RepID=A0A9E7GAY3_9LILI|nr:PRP4 pre-mRNA processing factor 4 [Musa troglodytarum]
MVESGDHKRRRGEEEGDGSPEISSPEAKRIRENLLLDDILDDDAGAGDQDLASVMKSLEEEIALPSPPPPQPQAVVAIDQPDLGYLFEASDDELGLPPPPPPAPSISDDGGEPPQAEVAVASGVGGEVDGVGFGQIWGFDDEINGYGWLDEFGIRPEERAEAEVNGVVFDGGLFDYADLPWRSETLPAV